MRICWGTGGNAEGFHKMNQIDSYGYDTLHRLTKVDYNNPGSTTGDEIYVYDSLGNRVTYTDTRNSVTRTYANNLANEYTTVATYAVTHDAAGNLSKQIVNGSSDAYVYAYDCDNRLLQVDYDPNSGSNTTVATFAYDALGRKITAWMMYDAPGGTQGDSNTSDFRLYHDGQVEIADYNSDGSLARRFINGTQYIDERAVLIEGPAASADSYYYLLQELYTVTGLIEKSGALAEADVYDGYGKVRIWDYSPGDFDRDGDVDATDQISFNLAKPVGGTGSGVPAKDPMADLDMDGDVDNDDSAAFTIIKNAGGAVTDAFVSSIGNPFFFTGRRLYFFETLPEVSSTAIANQQLQHNRARDYIPDLGRWGERDPLGYGEGLNLYEQVGSRPIVAADPFGMNAPPVTPPVLGPDPDPLRPVGGPPPTLPPPPLPPLPPGQSSGGRPVPGTAGNGQNCAGRSCDDNAWISWPDQGDSCTDTMWTSATDFVPTGCKVVNCSGVTVDAHRCGSCCESTGRLELIVFLYRFDRATASGTTSHCDFHMIGRNPCTERSWRSKMDKRENVDDIRDPWQSLADAYPVPPTKPNYIVVQRCFCCDKAQLRFEEKPRPGNTPNKKIR